MADPLAQQVEHNTFNVGVLGSSPKRITKAIKRLRLFVAVCFISNYHIPNFYYDPTDLFHFMVFYYSPFFVYLQSTL